MIELPEKNNMGHFGDVTFPVEKLINVWFVHFCTIIYTSYIYIFFACLFWIFHPVSPGVLVNSYQFISYVSSIIWQLSNCVTGQSKTSGGKCSPPSPVCRAHDIADHDCLVSRWLTERRYAILPIQSAWPILLFWTPGHWWVWHHQDLNLQSPNNDTNSLCNSALPF